MVRAALALERAPEAEPLLRLALALRSTVHPADDPRILEIKVSLIGALTSNGKADEARVLRAEIDEPLCTSTLPYVRELRDRLPAN